VTVNNIQALIRMRVIEPEFVNRLHRSRNPCPWV
jgi:hypothetical protein